MDSNKKILRVNRRLNKTENFAENGYLVFRVL